MKLCRLERPCAGIPVVHCQTLESQKLPSNRLLPMTTFGVVAISVCPMVRAVPPNRTARVSTVRIMIGTDLLIVLPHQLPRDDPLVRRLIDPCRI